MIEEKAINLTPMITNILRQVKLLVILLLISFGSDAQKNSGTFHISGRVRVDNAEPTGSVVSLTNLTSKTTENSATVSVTGKFEFDLNYFTEYRLTVVREGYYTKDIDVNTMIPSQVWAKDSIFPPFLMVVTIYKKVPNVTLSFEGKVVGKIGYSPRGKLDNFDSAIFIDDKDIRREIDQAIKAHEDELFNQKMAEAVEFEKKNQIREAIHTYEEALALRKNDQFIKPKLKELTSDLKNIEKDELLEAEFNKLLTTGDENISKLKYLEAIDNFKAALSIKPGNQVASDKLTNAEKLLANVNADKAKLEAEFNRLLASGDENVSGQKYTEAIDNFKGALALKAGDKVATAKLANAEQLLAKVNADKAKQDAEFNRLLAAGDNNVSGQKYPEAIENFKDALKIKPADPGATAKLANAEQLLAKVNTDKAKLEAEFNRLLAAGDNNVTGQKYPEAIENFKDALKIKPADPGATAKLANAEQLLARVNADKAKLEAEFNRLLAAGDNNVSGQKYLEAIENFKGALALKAGDKVATAKLANTEQLLAKVNADKAKLEAEFNRLLAAGDVNVSDQKYTEAIDNFKGALALKAGDQVATAKLANAEQLLAKVNADKAKQDAEFNRLLAAGDDNVTKQKYTEGITNFKDALKIKPSDKVATVKLANAEQLLTKVNADNAKLEAEFNRLLAAGDVNVSDQKYPEAIENFKGALILKAGDQVATAKLANAEKLLAKVNADKAKLEAEFNRLLAAGDDNVTKQKYTEGITNFKDALKIYPGHPVATSKLSDAERLLSQFIAEKQRKEAEQKLLADKLKKYKETIVRADQLFSDKVYSDAKDQYREAIKISAAEQYPKDRIAEIDTLLAQQAKERILAQKRAEEQRKLQGEGSYLKNIQAGDANFAKSLWTVAAFYYLEALKFKVSDKYALEKVDDCKKMIDSNITAERMLEYNTHIKHADEDLQSKKYSSARFYYQKALEILPWEVYPLGQMKEVEKLISSTDVNSIDAQYFDAIKKAEDAVVHKNLAVARFYFEKAITLKPEEDYPKQQLKRLSSEF